MREIKFRGRCVKSNDFVYGDLIHGVGSKAGNIYILPNKLNLAYVKHCDPLDGVQVKPESVGQFTGLHDKNGKEICEGDILRGTRVDGEHRHYKVWRCEGGFCINSFVSDFYKDPKDILFYSGLSDMQNASFVKGNCEVIGNIFENPEMLKQ